LLDSHVDAIIEKLIERATAGDPTALRYGNKREDISELSSKN